MLIRKPFLMKTLMEISFFSQMTFSMCDYSNYKSINIRFNQDERN